jgi:pilus assembly protein Flp/PilA
MTVLSSMLRRFTRDERAATMVEYAIMVALIAVIAIGAVELLGTTVNTTFGAANTALQ